MVRQPKLNYADICSILAHIYASSAGDMDHFLHVVELLLRANVVRLPAPRPIINFSNSFHTTMDDATAMHRYRFTVGQLAVLVTRLKLPEWIITTMMDRVNAVEALALLCRRLIEPCRLFTVANEFGRSVEACSRVIRCVVEHLFDRHQNVIAMHKRIMVQNAASYAESIERKSGLAGLRTCVAFIDGTKQYISRPSPRQDAADNENLQRAVYNGHPRRHCLSWQGITVPDGLIISMFGPVEGRRHDSTMLAMSQVLVMFQDDPVLQNFCLYGDPAYGCRDGLACPFVNAQPGSFEAQFNARMSSVRESVEWSFGLVKGLWPFINWDKKMKARKYPIGKLWLVAVLLTNCHTCLKPSGNQISQFFGLQPPSIDTYLA